ncbi:MAG: multiprotein-bridging factor 1 family protein [archaeon]
MECELCGRPALNARRVRIEGIEMLACEECARLGRVILGSTEQKRFAPKKIFFPSGESRDETVLVDKFGLKVQQARQKLGWTREETAKKLFEKESTLHRIELSEFKPSNVLLGKIEKLLAIDLKEKEE